jgi:metallophosphoesterase (TIGR03767 family)
LKDLTVLSHQRTLVAGEVLRAGSTASYRAIAEADGEAHVVRTELANPPSPETVPVSRVLACIAHLTDLHVTDVQSPARFEFINREYADPRFREFVPMHRPQEALNAHAIAAMVRALNAVEKAPVTGSPVGLAIVSGDAVDNVQFNELAAFAALLHGGQVRADSGGERYEGVQAPGWPDDIFWKPDGAIKGEDVMRRAYGFPHVPGLLERALRPFESAGLRMPWLGCHGNHEQVCQGIGIVTPRLAAGMVGFHKPIQLPDDLDRDSALETFVRRPESFMAGPDLPVTPDADRRPFTRKQFVDAHFRDGARPEAHGFTSGNRSDGTAYYVHDTAAVRFIVLDTVCIAGGADGCIDEDQVHWLERRLNEARDRPVVITSHHTLDTLGNRRRAGGPRYIDQDELLEVVHAPGNVVLWLNGHIHANAIRPRPDPRGSGRGFWEVTTSSVVDWPCQARLVELFDAGDGLLAIACTMVDHDGAVDPGAAIEPAQMAGLHRELALNGPMAGFASGRAGTPLDRNVILPVRWSPEAVAQRATVPYSATSRAKMVGGRARSALGAPARLLGRIGLTDEMSRQGLIAFLRTPRYEILPTEDSEALVLAHVSKDVTITITASPRKGIDATVSLAERLAKHGYQVVPHISARLIRDQSHLNEILERVTAIGRREVFVVAGDAKEPAGDFPDSVSLLAAITAEPHGLREIGITGYPERHSFIEDDLTIQAMWDKRRIATYIVSNLCFDPRTVKKWVARVRRRGVQLPIYVGLAGVSDPAKLLRVSTRIGLGDSARFLRGHSNWFMRMVQPGGYDPERFATGLLPELAAPERNVAGLHFFTFNEIEATERWRQEALARLVAA